MKSHFAPNLRTDNELWGMCLFPNDQDLIATCGDDATLRVWTNQHKKLLKCVKTNLDEKNAEIPPDHRTNDLADSCRGRSIAISHDGEIIVVGFKDGSLRLYDKELVLKNQVKQAKEWISDIKFSLDSTILAVGSHDNAIYIYSVNDMKSKCKPLRKHSSYITHIDFNLEGTILHSNCGAYELLFWDITSGK